MYSGNPWTGCDGNPTIGLTWTPLPWHPGSGAWHGALTPPRLGRKPQLGRSPSHGNDESSIRLSGPDFEVPGQRTRRLRKRSRGSGRVLLGFLRQAGGLSYEDLCNLHAEE